MEPSFIIHAMGLLTGRMSAGEKTALVTGACGFTGSHLLRHLARMGWDVVATDLEGAERGKYYTEGLGSVTNPVYFEDVFRDVGAEFRAADITEREELQEVFRGRDFDVVFHVASLFDYFAEWGQLEAVNVRGGRNVAELSAEHGVDRLVHWSTLGVLGGAEDGAVTEDASYDPHNRYCRSKVQQELEMKRVRDEGGLGLTIIRPAPIYGPGHRYGVYHILLLLRKFGVVPVMRVYPRSHRLMFPSVHVSDLVGAAEYLATLDGARGEAYHVLSDCIEQHRVLEFLAEALGLPCKRIPMPAVLYGGAYSSVLRWIGEKLEGRARSRGTRPKVDASMVEYLSKNMWFSNQKVRDAGYTFEYRDPRKGLWNYVTWCKREGLV